MDGGGIGGGGGQAPPSPPAVILEQCDERAIVAKSPLSERLLYFIVASIVSVFCGTIFLVLLFSGFQESVPSSFFCVLVFAVLLLLLGFVAPAPGVLRIDVPTRTYIQWRYWPPYWKVHEGDEKDFARIVLREFRYTSPSWWFVDLVWSVRGREAYTLFSVRNHEEALHQAREIASLLRLPLTDEKGQDITNFG